VTKGDRFAENREGRPADRNGCMCRLLSRSRGPPVMEAGRHPLIDFRELLRLHSRYGPLNCSTAQGVLDRNVLALYEARFSQALMK
jgi:hypothetical protein